MSRKHGGFVMSGNIIEIPQSKSLVPIWVQQLRVAVYYRVSPIQEEQQNSLKNQIELYTTTYSEIPAGGLSLFAMIPPQACGRIIVPAISSY